MENFKHTKGEWIAMEDGEANFYGVIANRNWLFRIQQNGELYSNEQIANIKLITTAPSLLNALVNLVNQVEGCELDTQQRVAVAEAKNIIKKLN